MTALTRLRLTDFRNYAGLDLKLDTRHVCLFGPNGAGKTNLLEAISQLGPGRGLRAAALNELKREGCEAGWTVSADLDDRRIGVGLDESTGGAKRVVRLDGAAAKSGDLAELIRIVWLTPAMDGVFRGASGDRRRFFDRQVMTFRPSHGQSASRYEKAMRERNALLERPSPDPAWADAIEARMAESGAELAVNRAEILGRLSEAIDGRPDGVFPKADLALDGLAESAAVAGRRHEDIAALLADGWRTSRRRDAAAGRTLDGPHRTDLIVYHRPSGSEAKNASTGQQKALLIGLILAAGTALLADTDAPRPILLLDEAAAHLDPDRRAALFDELDALGGQAWLTGTERFLFESFGDRAQRVEVNEGEALIA